MFKAKTNHTRIHFPTAALSIFYLYLHQNHFYYSCLDNCVERITEHYSIHMIETSPVMVQTHKTEINFLLPHTLHLPHTLNVPSFLPLMLQLLSGRLGPQPLSHYSIDWDHILWQWRQMLIDKQTPRHVPHMSINMAAIN